MKYMILLFLTVRVALAAEYHVALTGDDANDPYFETQPVIDAVALREGFFEVPTHAKTISVDLDAYERLRRARTRPNESFSRVIKRAVWASPPSTGAALLDLLERSPPLPKSVIERLEQAQTEDLPPPDSWIESPSTRHS